MIISSCDVARQSLGTRCDVNHISSGSHYKLSKISGERGTFFGNSEVGSFYVSLLVEARQKFNYGALVWLS
jgi:hypothetical protein